MNWQCDCGQYIAVDENAEKHKQSYALSKKVLIHMKSHEIAVLLEEGALEEYDQKMLYKAMVRTIAHSLWKEATQ